MSPENTQPNPAEHQTDRLAAVADALEKLEHQYEYSQLKTPELRQEYVQYTENLIADSIRTNADTVLFLDKSARPVAWLFKSLWPTLGFDEDGPRPMPHIKFANIDREQWGPVVGRSQDREVGIDMSRVHPDVVDDLRGLFAADALGDDEPAADKPTMFDDKDVIIVDEVSASGDTLRMANALFKMAIPEGRFHARHWMTPETKVDKRSGAVVNTKLPIWYSRDYVHGRLVANRADFVSSHSVSARQRRGAMFLSTRFPEVDQKGVALKLEMQQLGREVADGLIPVRPGISRSEAAQDVLMEQVNGLDYREYAALRKAADDDKPAFIKNFAEYKRDKLKHQLDNPADSSLQ